ncbi:MAG: CDP-alcohol phosphatidyltransferase family protein [Candidatus Aenigmatarchaeota archaeon]
MITRFREKLQRISFAIGKFCCFLSPNTWTMLSLLPAVITAFMILQQKWLAAALFLIIAAFIDAIDGAVARYAKKESKKGAYLDTIIDRYVELFIIIPLFVIPLPDLFMSAKIWLSVYLSGALLTSYVKAASAEKGLGQISGGLLERGERMLGLFIALCLARFSLIYMLVVIAALAVLAHITVLQRIFTALKSKKVQN